MKSSVAKGAARSPKEAVGDPCSANPTVKDITVMHAAGTGVLVHSSSPTVSNITQNGFGSTTYGIRMQAGASPTVSGSRFEGNTFGLYADPGTSATVANSGLCENAYGVYASVNSSVTAANTVMSDNIGSGAHILGGTHSFNGCAINNNNASGVHVAFDGTPVTINSSNLFENGLPAGNINLVAPFSPAPSIYADKDWWGAYGPRPVETATANITNPQPAPNQISNSLYGEASLWDYALENNCFIDENSAHLNYSIETTYAALVYPATQVWNGYKPGVVREAVAGDEPVVPVNDYAYGDFGYGPAWALAEDPGDPGSICKVVINPWYMKEYKCSDSLIVGIITHELGHCLWLGDHNNTPETNVMTQWHHGSSGPYGRPDQVPLSKNDKASYDATYRNW